MSEQGRHSGVRVLLSHYLSPSFASIFRWLGCEVVWADRAEELRALAAECDIDVAFEWQHAENDFPVRDMLRDMGKTGVLLVMCRNYRKGLWDNEADVKANGYDVALDTPFPVAKLDEILKRARRPRDHAEIGEKNQETIHPSGRGAVAENGQSNANGVG